jgi:hypothetical protein
MQFLTAEAGREKSRKKHKKTKGSSSDVPFEVLPIGEDDSEKSGDEVHKSNQIVEKPSDSEMPQKSGIITSSPGQFKKEIEKLRILRTD